MAVESTLHVVNGRSHRQFRDSKVRVVAMLFCIKWCADSAPLQDTAVKNAG